MFYLSIQCTRITLVLHMCMHAGYMIGTASLSHRLGGLYCLYCLYETQPFKPPFKIYLSLGAGVFYLSILNSISSSFLLYLWFMYKHGSSYCFVICFHFAAQFTYIPALTGELKKLKNLVVVSKEKGLKVVPALVRRMLKKNMFLFGFVDVSEGSTETVNQLTELQNARIQLAYKKYV